MLTDQLLSLSSAAHEVVLWFLIVLSVFSLAVILDRFFFLKDFLSETSLILSEMISALESGRKRSHEIGLRQILSFAGGKTSAKILGAHY